MSCIELLNILSKPWANVQDIMKIMNCGRDSAIKMRDTIIEEIHNCGKEVPNGKTIVVPMQYIVEKLDLDLEYLTKMAKLEQYLEVIANDTAVNYASISK